MKIVLNFTVGTFYRNFGIEKLHKIYVRTLYRNVTQGTLYTKLTA